MNFFEYIGSAFRCLTTNKMRTFLTTLGIIVGISSVILINTLGTSLGGTMNSELQSAFDGNQIELDLIPKSSLIIGGMYISMETPDKEEYFSQDLLDAYEENFKDDIKTSVVPTVMTQLTGDISGKLMTDSGSENVRISRSDTDSEQLISVQMDMPMKKGRFVNEYDIEHKSQVIVISDKCAKNIFGTEDAVGKQLTFLSDDLYNPTSCSYTIVGIYQYSAYIEMYLGSEASDAFVPYTQLDDLMGADKEDNLQIVLYKIKSNIDSDDLTKQTQEFFDPYYENTEYKVNVFTLDQSQKLTEAMVEGVTKVISALAAISLIVGGIGVMNIMLVSVTERTMEIGVRKAMGASNRSIRFQFLAESVIIVLVGSVLGIGLGLFNAKLISLIAAKTMSFTLAPPTKAIIESVIFSFIIGIVFGVSPANKAARMEVVDALRYE